MDDPASGAAGAGGLLRVALAGLPAAACVKPSASLASAVLPLSGNEGRRYPAADIEGSEKYEQAAMMLQAYDDDYMECLVDLGDEDFRIIDSGSDFGASSTRCATVGSSEADCSVSSTISPWPSASGRGGLPRAT